MSLSNSTPSFSLDQKYSMVVLPMPSIIKRQVFPSAFLERTNERHAKDLAGELVTLVIDHLHIAGEVLGDDLSQVADETGVAHLDRHGECDADDLGFDIRAEIPLDQWLERFGTCLLVGTLLGELGLRQKQVRSRRNAAYSLPEECSAGREEGPPVRSRVVQFDLILLGLIQHAQYFETVRCCGVLLQQSLTLADDPADTKFFASR